MTTVWRIVKERHAGTAFSGEGAAKTGGRWNSRGTRVVYASATQSLAALELLVHLNPPVVFRLVAFPIEFNEALVEECTVSSLPPEWQAHPPPAATQTIGDHWVRAARSAILSIPSVLVPDERNYLLNPAHRDFSSLRIGPPRPFALDPRLLGQR